jgi:Tfp pilus assembly protein PilZ
MENASLSFDKRKHPRIQVIIPVQYKVINQTDEAVTALEQKKVQMVGRSKDFSAQGLFLVSDRVLEKGDILKVEVVLPNEHKPMRTFSEVVWLSDEGLPEGKHGAGICFMALRDEDADKIGRFVAGTLKEELGFPNPPEKE